MRPLPITLSGVIEELESLYPARCIGPEETPENAHRYAGKVELIAELRGRHDAVTKRGELETVL
jgi:hypothetical protein